MTTKITDLVGLTEIAERCHVNKNIASGWTRKHTFPQIKLKLAMGPMWDWNEVEEHLYGPKPGHEVATPIRCAHCGDPTICGDTNPIAILITCDLGHKTRLELADRMIPGGPIQTTIRTIKEDA